jgi:hypothetical protein
MDSNSSRKTKRKIRLLFVPISLLFIAFIAFTVYFFAVNIFLKDSVLPRYRLGNDEIGLMSRSDLDAKYQSIIDTKLGENLKMKIDGEEIEISKSDLNPDFNTDNLIEYGRGNNPVNLARGILGMIQQRSLEPQIDMNIDNIIGKFPFNLEHSEVVTIKDDILLNCENKNFGLRIDSAKLKRSISNQIFFEEEIIINTYDYIADEEDKKIVVFCKVYYKQEPKIKNLVTEIIPETDLDNIFGVKVLNDDAKWEILDAAKLNSILIDYKSKKDLVANDGSYEIINNEIYLYDMYTIGKSFKINESFASILEWLNNDEQSSPLVYDEIKPEVLKKGLSIKDFSQIMGEGFTRMNLDYDNRIGQAYNAEVGFNEISNVIVNPGEEFSFFNTLQPYGNLNEFTKNGNLIDTGICTTVTTLFRSVLDAGLPVTFRENHGEYVWKYTWNQKNGDPSGLDLVDATFLALPGSIIDFRFKNDFNAPVLIQTELRKEADNFQYHKVTLRTASDQQKREVFIGNWRTENRVSRVRFDAYFDRIVKINGNVHIQETYKSDYQWGY